MPAPHLEIVPKNTAVKNTAVDTSPRAELADAIARRNKADERAAAARDIARRAERACADARLTVNDFKAKHDAKLAELREVHVKAISETIKQDKPVPGAPTPAPLDVAALAAAEQQHAALEVSSTYLALEAQEAATEAGKAMDAVRAAAVMDHDAKRIVGELIAARDIFWKLTEQASGFFLVDARRPGGPKFAAAPGHYLPRRAKSEN